MRWTPGGRSRNIEDRRGQRGVGGGFPVGRAGMGLGGTLLVLILSLVFGGDIFSGGGVPVDPTGGTTTATGEVAPVQETAEEAKMVEFMSFVLDDAQAAWAHAFPQFLPEEHRSDGTSGILSGAVWLASGPAHFLLNQPARCDTAARGEYVRSGSF